MHAQVMEAHYQEMMTTDEGRRRIQMADDWRRDPANAYALRILGDPWGGWTPDQVCALDALLSANTAGWLRMQYVEVGAEPGLDSDREGNRAKLANLPLGFTATVYDHLSHEGDGWLTIPDDLGVRNDSGVQAVPGDDRVSWEGAPIEIGSTSASRTWWHLAQCGIVARWPFECDRIYVITTVPKFAFRRDSHVAVAWPGP